MSSKTVPYCKRVRVLSCVSIIAQSRAIDKVYLSSRLHNVLWNCYFFRLSTFKGLYLYSFARAIFSKDTVFQNSELSRGNLVEFSNLELLAVFVLEEFNKNINFMLNFSEESVKKPTINLPLK